MPPLRFYKSFRIHVTEFRQAVIMVLLILGDDGMKRWIAFGLSLTLLLALAGCGKAGEQETDEPLQTILPTSAPTTLSPEIGPAETQPPQTEAVQALPEPEDGALVRVTDYIPEIRQDLRYATTDNFTGQRIYDFTDVYLRYGTVKKLAKVCEELAQQGLGLKIWDGYRPVEAQAALWEICPDPAFVSHPVTGSRSHCRGSAVDVTLVDLESGEELEVPTSFDNFTAYADRDYSDCPAKAAANAALLEDIMKKHGFKPYSAEWWHFSDTENYPVEEHFYPTVSSVWEANCEEFINLREAPDSSEILTKIPRDETMTLLGWEGRYAQVEYEGQVGYVMSSYILPVNQDPMDALTTVAPTDTYSYGQLLENLDSIAITYPELTEVEIIGTSELGREIPVLRIGDVDARYHVLLQGAIHGREHMTAWALAAMADYWLSHDILSYGDICWHIIPMSNPDGVTISQTGKLNEEQKLIFKQDTALGYTDETEAGYALLWKANGQGVDINRNFPSGWEELEGMEAPSAQQYPGEAPFSTVEAQALRDYTLRYDFDATVSYHATGSLIYYEYGDDRGVNDASRSLASVAAEVTGYTLESSGEVTGAGYKDWAMDALGIPSLTIEIGCEQAPLDERELASIFARNYRVLPAIARWLQTK